MSAIEVDELTKSYGAVQALDGVSFSVGEGEVFGLLGPNGAGKSTTVRVLVTLTQPDGGSATVAGHDVGRDAERRAARDRLRAAGVRRRPLRDRPREPRCCRGASRAWAAAICAAVRTSCSSSSGSPTPPTASCAVTRAA